MPNLNRASQATAGTAGRRPERRRCLRRKMLESGEMVPVDLGPMETGLLLDISAKGASVQGPNPLNPGLRLSLRFRLPESEISVHPTYEVVWTEPGGKIGLRFLYMAEREQRQMEEWLAAHLPKPVPTDSLKEVLQGVPSRDVPEPPATPAAPVPELRELPVLGTEAAGLTLATALSRVVEQAHSLTQADGAAIALREGSEIICRASFGNAPDVGMTLNPESGLSGECIRTGRTVNCRDAGNDARVDPSIAEQLNLRSTLIVPVIAGEAVTGLVEVLSSRPAAFTTAHQASLERMAAIVSFLTGPPVPKPGAADDQQTEAHAAAEPEEPARAAGPEPPEPAPGMSLTAFHAEVSELIELLEPELAAVPGGPKEEREPVHLAEPATASPPQPAPLAEPVPSFLVEPKRRLSRRGLLTILAIALGLVLISAAGWVVGSGRFSRWTKGTPAPNAQPAANGASAAPAGTPAVDTAATTIVPRAVEPKKTSAAPASTKARVAVITIMPETPGPNMPPSDLAPSPTALGGVTSTMPVIPAPAPVNPGRGENGTRNSDPHQPLRVAPELMHARLLKGTSPPYPPFARAAGISGTVVLDVLIGADGRVKSVGVVSGNPVLAGAAQDAVRQWRYQSYVLHDKPVEVITTVRMMFSLPR